MHPSTTGGIGGCKQLNSGRLDVDVGAQGRRQRNERVLIERARQRTRELLSETVRELVGHH